MYRKYLLAAALVAAFTVPSFAAATFYVQQDAKTHKCSVSSTKPDGKATMMIGTAGYTSQAAADAAMKIAKECKA